MQAIEPRDPAHPPPHLVICQPQRANRGQMQTTEVGPHLEPGGAEQVEVLVEQLLYPQTRLVRVVKALAEEDVGDDVAGGVAQEKGGVEGLAWKTRELLGSLHPPLRRSRLPAPGRSGSGRCHNSKSLVGAYLGPLYFLAILDKHA